MNFFYLLFQINLDNLKRKNDYYYNFLQNLVLISKIIVR